MLEVVSFGLTIISTGIAARQLLTGHTMAKKLDEANSRIGRLESHMSQIRSGIWKIDEVEILDRSIRDQRYLDDDGLIKVSALKVIDKINAEIIFSKSIIMPDRLSKYFNDSPEAILHNIDRLEKAFLDQSFNEDPTMTCPLQTAPAAIKSAGALKEFIDATEEAFSRRDHQQAS